MNDHDKKIAKEMLGFMVHIIWPILIIVVIAKVYGPTSF